MRHFEGIYKRIDFGAISAIRAGGLLMVVLAIAGCASVRGSTGSLAFVGNVWASGVSADPGFLRYWNQVTVENAGKWGNVEPVRGEMQWHDLDVAYEFARRNRIPFRLHTLVWGQSQPSWLGALSPEELKRAVTDWFTLLGERYPDVDMIDVVNEPFHLQPPYAAALGGAGQTRWDWVIASFDLARKHFPHAELGVNEYGILAYADATSGYLRLVSLLKARHLIDYIGVQAHGLEKVPADTVAANLKLLAQAGLPIYVTELDLGIPDDQEQAAKMKALFTVFAGNRQVRGVTLWGYREDRIYKRSATLLRVDGTERPALTWLREFAAGLRHR